MNRKIGLPIALSAALAACACSIILAGNLSPGARDVASRALLAIGFLLTIIYVAMGASRKRSPAFEGFGKASYVANAPEVTFADVAANAEARESLAGLVDYLRDPAKYCEYGARMPKGVLLYGPPGTGKTLLARALAGEAGVPFFAMSGSDFVQMYVGVGAGRVRELFAGARKAGKCVIFIDEIDALGKRRNDMSSDERDQTLNALLSEMSGFRSGEGIIVLAATNRMDALDPALLRPGRFDRHIEVGLPGASERRDILALHSRNKPMAEDIDLTELAGDTVSFSGASLEALLNEAAMIAARRGAGKIERADMDRAFINTVAGADRPQAANAEERQAIALHEAGHAVVLHNLMPESKLKRISILPAGRGAAGYNLTVNREHVLVKKGEMEAQMAVLLAGRAAEMLLGGEDCLTSGASGDLSRAAELAGVMAMDLGMTGEPAISLRALGAACGGAAGADKICRELLNKAYAIATATLENDVENLMALTKALLARDTLDSGEIARILMSNELRDSTA